IPVEFWAKLCILETMNIIDTLIQTTVSRKINHFAIYPHTVFIETPVNTGYATPLGANYCLSVKDVGSLHLKTTDELALPESSLLYLSKQLSDWQQLTHLLMLLLLKTNSLKKMLPKLW
ncbi:MAG: hypothetical protein PF689_12210, partial [Deltaproteobacteria bacterium]|nr:hypothetical protein [Deltaproteobacteria bacterium]